jgi:hypothetical protein
LHVDSLLWKRVYRAIAWQWLSAVMPQYQHLVEEFLTRIRFTMVRQFCFILIPRMNPLALVWACDVTVPSDHKNGMPHIMAPVLIVMNTSAVFFQVSELLRPEPMLDVCVLTQQRLYMQEDE